MKPMLVAVLLVSATLSSASAQSGAPGPEPVPVQPPPPAGQSPAGQSPANRPPPPAGQPAVDQPEPVAQPLPTQVNVTYAPAAAPAPEEPVDGGWRKPVGRRFLHGFRLGWTYVMNYEKPTREDGTSLMTKFELKSPNMLLIGYEGFYRIVGHSWLNVVMVGNVTVAGLEQSKFIPAASGLIGFEFDHSFQLGVGVNLTPDPESPSHMIIAAGWTPRVGGIHTPVHFFFVPDTEKNHRMGATIGVTW